MQWVEAAAPSNFLASNPDALKAMADQGARVVISSRKPGPCQEVADEIN